MSRSKCCPLAGALVAMLPNAEILHRQERSWHSATFSGSRITFDIAVPADTDRAKLADIRKALPDHDFALKRGFVADATVLSESRLADDQIKLEIEILLLDE